MKALHICSKPVMVSLVGISANAPAVARGSLGHLHDGLGGCSQEPQRKQQDRRDNDAVDRKHCHDTNVVDLVQPHIVVYPTGGLPNIFRGLHHSEIALQKDQMPQRRDLLRR